MKESVIVIIKKGDDNMDFQNLLLKIYESADNGIITEGESNSLVEAAYEQYIDLFISECEMRYLDEIASLPIMETTDEEIDMDDYAYLKCKIYESVDNGDISQDFGEFVLDIITEAEKDHRAHMAQKKIAAKRMGVKVKDLPNKKYDTDENGKLKNPEKARKADLKYQYKDKMLKKTNRGVSYQGNMWNVDMKAGTAKESDIKMLEYLKKKGKEGDEESIKKYKQVFRMFCNKWGIDENSSLHVMYSPSKVFKGKMGIAEWKEGNAQDSKKNYGVEKGHALPSGYCLLHKSPVDGIKELKPTRTSNKYLGAGKSGINGQYRLTGRIYFTLQKDEGDKTKLSTGRHATGSHFYKLADHISEFYLDSENGNSRGMDKLDISKLIGKAVYVKTEKPLKVIQLK